MIMQPVGIIKVEHNLNRVMVYQFLIWGRKNFGEYKPYFEMMLHKRPEPKKTSFRNNGNVQNADANPCGKSYYLGQIAVESPRGLRVALLAHCLAHYLVERSKSEKKWTLL